MPYLGNHLNFAQYEARKMAVENGNPNPPSGNVKGQLFFNNVSNELFYWDGTIWQSAKSGAGSSGPPSGPAGGDLSGTYPNPAIGALKVTDAHVATANKDGATGTPSLRTIGQSALQAMSGATTLDNIIPPATNVSMNNKRIVTLADPTVATDAATKQYVDGKTPPDATTSVKGIVQLAGDLAGTAAAPVIAPRAITDAEVATANLDGAAGTFSMRSLGFTVLKAMPGDARLDQITAPTAPVSLNSQKIVGLATPTASADAATKAYVDQQDANLAQGLDAKASVKLASTANLPLSGTTGFDGVAISAGDRILAKDQSTNTANGIYVVAAGAWSRAADADTFSELVSAFVWVEQGTINGDTGWVCTADQGGAFGSDPIIWTQFSGSAQITAGDGMSKTGNTLNVGVGQGLQANADTIQVADNTITDTMLKVNLGVNLAGTKVFGTLPLGSGGTGGTTQGSARNNLNATGIYSSAVHGAGTTITIPSVTHSLSSTNRLVVQVVDEATGNVELPDINIGSGGTVTVTFGVSVAANSKRVTILGV